MIFRSYETEVVYRWIGHRMDAKADEIRQKYQPRKAAVFAMSDYLREHLKGEAERMTRSLARDLTLTALAAVYYDDIAEALI